MLKNHIEHPLRMDHLAIWVGDMDKTLAFLTDIVGWKVHPMVIEVDADDPTVGGMKAIFVDGNGLWLELIEPTTAGPGMDILEQRGPGAIVEANFEALGSDYFKAIDIMEAKGIKMLAMDGSPLVNYGRIDEGVQGMEETAETGQHIAYWPTEQTGGTTVEIYSRELDDKTSLLNVRDLQWKDVRPDPKSPRAHHVVIMVKNIDHAAGFYTETMGLKRSPENFNLSAEDNDGVGSMKIAFINSGNEKFWLELCQPEGPGPVMDYLIEKGEGQMTELVIEVDDLGEYYDTVLAKGVQLVDIGGKPIASDKKYDVLQPSGEKIAYFPKDAACGMNIEIVERGPRETSIMHRLYNTAV